MDYSIDNIIFCNSIDENKSNEPCLFKDRSLVTKKLPNVLVSSVNSIGKLISHDTEIENNRIFEAKILVAKVVNVLLNIISLHPNCMEFPIDEGTILMISNIFYVF